MTSRDVISRCNVTSRAGKNQNLTQKTTTKPREQAGVHVSLGSLNHEVGVIYWQWLLNTVGFFPPSDLAHKKGFRIQLLVSVTKRLILLM